MTSPMAPLPPPAKTQRLMPAAAVVPIANSEAASSASAPVQAAIVGPMAEPSAEDDGEGQDSSSSERDGEEELAMDQPPRGMSPNSRTWLAAAADVEQRQVAARALAQAAGVMVERGGFADELGVRYGPQICSGCRGSR